jgi:hypothetical protein
MSSFVEVKVEPDVPITTGPAYMKQSPLQN